MKKTLVYSLVVLVLAVLSFTVIRDDAGYVIVAYKSTTYEMTLGYALFCFLVLMVVALLVVKMFRKSWGALAGSVSWISESQHKKASRRTQEGLVQFIEGNWRDAKKNLVSAARHSNTPLVHYLASARSAYEMGDHDETQKLLLEAEKIAPENTLAILLTQARIQLADKKYEQCLVTLQRARASYPNNPVVLDLLRKVYWQLNDWESMLELLPKLRASRHESDTDFLQFEESFFCAYLSSVSVDKKNALSSYELAWQQVPKHLKHSSRIVAFYSQLLHNAKLDDCAETLIRPVLNKNWDSSLVSIYGRLNTSSPKQQLSAAEKWLKHNSDDADLQAALGRICVRLQLWGKARTCFERSLLLHPSPEVYADLGSLLDQLGESEKSAELYHKGLLISTGHL